MLPWLVWQCSDEPRDFLRYTHLETTITLTRKQGMDSVQSLLHIIFTFGAYLMSNWTEIGAAVLMLMQFTLLVLKLYDGYKKRYKKGKEDE